MANENNNINELVADDDPTAELELPTFSTEELEADANTYPSEKSDVSDVSASELKLGIKSREKTIGKLQYDIERLHAKWLGLEAEITAREAQTQDLNDQLGQSKEQLARKDRLIKKRDSRVKALKSEIRERDQKFRGLVEKLEETQRQLQDQAIAEAAPAVILVTDDTTSRTEMLQRLRNSETYADGLRQQVQDLMAVFEHTQGEQEFLSTSIAELQHKSTNLSANLLASEDSVEELQNQLQTIHSEHEEEMRTMRFELGEAQNTVIEADDVKSQLASDLMAVRSCNDELEQLLSNSEESSNQQIENLTKEISQLKRTNASYEQKLTTKSEAITVLLSELAKKSEQIESIGEIEDVIHDIDERISERSTGKAAAERVTRFLVGVIDGQTLRFPLFKERQSIGRTEENDIQLNANYVSRRHAVLQTDDGQTRIIDWGSKNGVYVNSERVTEQFLAHGDMITIGNARFRFEERKKRDA